MEAGGFCQKVFTLSEFHANILECKASYDYNAVQKEVVEKKIENRLNWLRHAQSIALNQITLINVSESKIVRVDNLIKIENYDGAFLILDQEDFYSGKVSTPVRRR